MSAAAYIILLYVCAFRQIDIVLLNGILYYRQWPGQTVRCGEKNAPTVRARYIKYIINRYNSARVQLEGLFVKGHSIFDMNKIRFKRGAYIASEKLNPQKKN